MIRLGFSRIRKVRKPIISTEGSAGIDFFIPGNFPTTFIKPNKSILIPSGIKINLPTSHTLIAFNKSGIATKKKLIIGAQVIDSDYQGEIHLHLINTSKEIIQIEADEKIAQFILFKIPSVSLVEINQTELFDIETQRGDKGFGSTK